MVSVALYQLRTYILKFEIWLYLHGVVREHIKNLKVGHGVDKVENPCSNGSSYFHNCIYVSLANIYDNIQ